MKILISCRSYYQTSYNEQRDCIDQRLIEWVIFLGFEPIIIPNVFGQKKNLQQLKNFLKSINPSGLILSGGEDFGINKKRDFLEKNLLNYFLKKKKPILGICRGFQLVCKNFGSKLIKANEKVRKVYNIQINDKLKKKIIKTSCYFNFSIDRIPNNFDLVGFNQIKKISPWMIRSKDNLCECWMIHPEREKKFNFILAKRAKNFFLKR